MAYYSSQGRVEIRSRRGGQFCRSFVANLLEYLCAKNCQNAMRFDKAIAKNRRVHFFASQCIHVQAYVVTKVVACKITLTIVLRIAVLYYCNVLFFFLPSIYCLQYSRVKTIKINVSNRVTDTVSENPNWKGCYIQ